MALLLVVDDHPLFCNGFAHMVREWRPEWRLHFAGSAAEALCYMRETTPDLVLADLGLPDDDGFAMCKAIAAIAPDVPQVVITGREDRAARVRARGCGARGFLVKTAPPDVIAGALDAVLAGGTAFPGGPDPAMLPALTSRQADVLTLLAEGHGNKEIRHRLGIAERTVRAHLTELFQLLGAHSRTQALLRARELGLIC